MLPIFSSATIFDERFLVVNFLKHVPKHHVQTFNKSGCKSKTVHRYSFCFSGSQIWRARQQLHKVFGTDNHLRYMGYKKGVMPYCQKDEYLQNTRPCSLQSRFYFPKRCSARGRQKKFLSMKLNFQIAIEEVPIKFHFLREGPLVSLWTCNFDYNQISIQTAIWMKDFQILVKES